MITLTILSGLLVAACSPAMDWRDLRVPGTALAAQFPCKPVRHARELQLANTKVEWTMFACSVGSVAYAVGHAQLSDAAAMNPALAELAQRASAQLHAPRVQPLALGVPGATPFAQAQALRLGGKRSDGRATEQHLVVFAHGLQVFQASLIGPALDAEASATFFAALRIAP